MRIKSDYQDVKEGTKKSKALKLILRPQGATIYEVIKGAKYNLKTRSIEGIMQDLINMNGYDIRVTSTDNSRGYPLNKDKNKFIHKRVILYFCVGRFSWNGDYEDFTKEAREQKKIGENLDEKSNKTSTRKS